MPNPYAAIWQQAAANTATTAMGIGVQRIGAKYDRRQQLLTQDALMAMQMKYNKEMLDYQNEQNLKYYSPEAEKNRLKEAGLSPGLMYGMSGAGGMTQGGTPNVSAPNAGIQDTTGQAALGMGINIAQLKLLAAQEKNINADTANKEADTANKPIAGAQMAQMTEESKTRQKELLQGIENAKAQEALTKAQTKIVNIEFGVAEQTADSRIKRTTAETSRAIDEAISALNQAKVDQNTVQAKIDILKREAVLKLLEQSLTRAQTTNVTQDTKLKLEQAGKLVADRLQGWEDIGIRKRQMEIDKTLRETGLDLEDRNGVMRAISEIINIGFWTGNNTPIEPKRNPIGFK